MANDELLTDDYVAGLLREEASDCSLKYSALGMEGFRTNNKPANMLRPNTRFLRHIIKDTDHHNKALLAKEAAESRARLKDLEQAEEEKRRKTNPNAKDIRRRQMGDIHAILGGKKRPRDDSGEEKRPDRESRSRNPKTRESEDGDTNRKSEKDSDLFKRRDDDRRRHGRLSREDGRSKTDERSHRDRHRRTRSRSRDAPEGRERRRHGRPKSDGSRPTRSRRRSRSRSPQERKSRHRERSPLDETKDAKREAGRSDESDSDPLEEFIGPAPPPVYRGRGTVGGSSGIDRRFSETYDPKADVQMPDDEAGGTTWDDAVEAFRDRQKLRQNQEQRMRAAGFADDQISKLNGTKELAETDVRWTKVGEKREWDKGKVAGLDGGL